MIPAMYDDGLVPNQIALLLGLSKVWVCQVLRDEGRTVKDRGRIPYERWAEILISAETTEGKST